VRPDLVLSGDAAILILELTVCHESNLQSSRTYKTHKYENIAASRREQWKHIPVELFTLEVSILGFISDMNKFVKAAALPNIPCALKTKLIHTAINCSFDIYKNRNNPKFKYDNTGPIQSNQ
jgi:hypothetical protein